MLYNLPIADVFDLRVEPTHESASLARQQTREFLDDAGVPTAIAADIELIVSELTSNAVNQGPVSPVWLSVAITSEAVYLTVANQSTGERLSDPRNEPQLAAPATVLAEGGRGLAIVQALVDGMWINSDSEWTSVSCLRRFG